MRGRWRRSASFLAEAMALAGLVVLFVTACAEGQPPAAGETIHTSAPAGSDDPAPPTQAGQGRPENPPVYDLAAAGAGPCSTTALGEVIVHVHQSWPDLVDVNRLYRPDYPRAGDGNYIFAFSGAPGFNLVFKRGGGDCPAGCTENEYWYFATDVACEPVLVGQYWAAWGSDNCLQTTGTPLWNVPRSPDPTVVCGAGP